jgi:hypothetical protein
VARSSLVGSALVVVAFAVLLDAATARADDMATGTQPVAYSARPLTVPALTLALQASSTVDKLSTTTVQAIYSNPNAKNLNVGVALGASVGIVENIEVGAVVAPLQVLPSFSYGDPSVHGTFRFLKGGFEMAGYVNSTFITHQGVAPQVTLPVLNSGAGVLLQPGLLSRIHMGERAKLDIGATVPIQLGSAAHDIGLDVPVELAFNLIESLHVGASSGFGIADLKAPALNSYVPLGLLAGVSFGSDDKPVVDLGALFQWPQFANPGKSQTIDTGDFQVGLSFAAYVYLM